MENKDYTGIVPRHETGVRIDSEDSVELKSAEEAKQFFKTVENRLLQVNDWHELAGALSATFQVVDPQGQEVSRPVQQGDYFKIDVPGPGSQSGEGYDWVQVEEVCKVSQGDVESVGIRVRPASNPQNKKEDIAHFYSEESTSNFLVTREGAKVSACIYDRNTKPNQQADTVMDKVRDATVGAGGVALFSKLQWTSLIKGLLQTS